MLNLYKTHSLLPNWLKCLILKISKLWWVKFLLKKSVKEILCKLFKNWQLFLPNRINTPFILSKNSVYEMIERNRRISTIFSNAARCFFFAFWSSTCLINNERVSTSIQHRDILLLIFDSRVLNEISLIKISKHQVSISSEAQIELGLLFDSSKKKNFGRFKLEVC